ncbi:MAG: glutathione S-transferase family protein [Candidatus Phaeomarinobacter sp.]
MLELHMFPMSHFNEKVRWALDYKDIPHTRIPYMPGPHAGKIRKLSGQEQTPVVRFEDGDVLAGSTDIVLELEKRFPKPALLPADEELRRQAMDIVEQFDGDIAVKERRSLFVHLIEEPDYLCAMFSRGQTPMKRFVYRRMLPLVKGMMRSKMDIHGDALEEGVALTREAFDFVAEKSAATGYLAGNQFSIADLTAAAILAPSVEVSHPDMQKPVPVVPRVKAFLDQFADHPGANWVKSMYQKHRMPLTVAA